MAKKSDEIRPTDGRRNNKRLPKKVVLKESPTKYPAKMNQAKKNQVKDYSVKAIKKVFGSEEKAMEMLAEQSKDSFQHLKLLLEYAYGKAGDQPDEVKKTNNTPIINFFGELPKQEQIQEDIIDIQSEDITDESED